MKQIFPIVLLACILMTSCSNSDDYFTPENLCDEPQHSQMSEDSVKQIYQQMRMIVREQVAKDVIEYKEKTNDATVPKIVTGADYLAFLMNRPEYIEKYCQENADAIYAAEKNLPKMRK